MLITKIMNVNFETETSFTPIKYKVHISIQLKHHCLFQSYEHVIIKHKWWLYNAQMCLALLLFSNTLI